MVRSAMPRVEWSDARCAVFASKLLCLGHRSFELLYDFLFENALVSLPSKILYDEVTLPLDVTTAEAQLLYPASFSNILSSPCPCSPTDFSIFIAYLRNNGHKLPDLASSASATATTTISAATAPCASSASCQGTSSNTALTPAAGDLHAETRTRSENVRALERLNYRRRQLRKVADEMDWPGAAAFYDLYGGRAAPV